MRALVARPGRHRASACLLALVALFLGGASASASTIAYTDLSSRQWRQVTETVGLSWNELNSVCATGTCTADFGPYDLTGWRWASQDEIRSLYNEFIFAATGTKPLGTTFQAPGSSLWASSFVSSFSVTYIEPGTNDEYVNGWASTAANVSDGFGPSIRDCQPASHPNCLDRADVGDAYDKSLHFPGIAGAWLYQPSAAPVPEPATLLLFGSGMAAAGVRRYRRRAQCPQNEARP